MSNNQIIKLVSEATEGKAVRLTDADHAVAATVEGQVPAGGTGGLRTAPVVAVGPATAQRTIAVEQVACSMEF